jgi:TPR repeat protein
MYLNGRGVPQDYAAAVSWFQKAADQGDPSGQNSLGAMHVNGWGVPQDDVTALSWFRKAADQGYAVAQNSLGGMYATGRGVPPDFVGAHMWFNLAAAGGIMGAAHNRDVVAAKMTRAQVAEAKSRAAAWRPSKTANAFQTLPISPVPISGKGP